MIYLLRKIILPVVFIIALVMVMSVFVPPPKAATITSAADQRGTLVIVGIDNSAGHASISLITNGSLGVYRETSERMSGFANILAERYSAKETHYALYYPGTSLIKTRIDLENIVVNSSEAELAGIIVNGVAGMLGKKLVITGVETKKENEKTLPPPRPPKEDKLIKQTAGGSKMTNDDGDNGAAILVFANVRFEIGSNNACWLKMVVLTVETTGFVPNAMDYLVDMFADLSSCPWSEAKVTINKSPPDDCRQSAEVKLTFERLFFSSEREIYEFTEDLYDEICELLTNFAANPIKPGKKI